MPWKDLKEARERRGITIVDAAGKLKISKEYLSSIERGDFASLPDPVFSRGFIRNYCRFLGLEGAELLEMYNESLEKRKPAQLGSFRSLPEVEKSRFRLGRISAVGLTVIGIFLILFFVVHSQVTKERKKLAEKEKLESTIPGAPPLMQMGKKGELPRSAVPGVLQKKTLHEAARPVNKEKEGPPPTGMNLEIVARELTWLYIVPDKGKPVDVTLYPGDELFIKAEDRIRIKVGNAGGIEVSLNGKQMGLLGSSGEVVEKTLLREGVE